MYMYDNDPEMLQALKDRLYSSETEDERLQFIIEHQAAYPPAMIEFLVNNEEVLEKAKYRPLSSGMTAGAISNMAIMSSETPDAARPALPWQWLH